MAITIRVEIPPASKFPGALWRKAELAIEAALKDEVKELIKDAMQKRVANWSISIEFVGRYSQFGGAVGAMTVFPRGAGRNRWEWVSRGTGSRPISVKSAPYLNVRMPYTGKTAPGNIYGRSSSYGNVRPKGIQSVSWPGIEARLFEENIVNEEAGTVLQIIDRTIRNVI